MPNAGRQKQLQGLLMAQDNVEGFTLTIEDEMNEENVPNECQIIKVKPLPPAPVLSNRRSRRRSGLIAIGSLFYALMTDTAIHSKIRIAVTASLGWLLSRRVYLQLARRIYHVSCLDRFSSLLGLVSMFRLERIVLYVQQPVYGID